MGKSQRRRKHLKRRVATVVSRVFDPVWLIPLMLAAAVVWSVYNGLRWRFLLVLLFIDAFIPFIYFVHLLKTREISDWDTTKRTERYRLYGFTIVVHAAGVLVAWLIGKTVLAEMLFAFWLVAVGYGLVTLRWKISLHTGVAGCAIGFLSFLFGPTWLWGFVVVLVIGWARVSLGKHTVSQVIVGAVLAPLLLWAGLTIVGVSRFQAAAPSEQRFYLN